MEIAHLVANCPHKMSTFNASPAKYCFTALCNSANADDRLATKTMISNFLQPSTKSNFLFFCNKCLTKLEVSSVESDSNRINVLETKMNNIDNQLKEITSMLKSTAGSSTSPTKQNQNQTLKERPKDNIWFDSEKLATVKAPPVKAVLVISNTSDPQTDTENQNIVEKTIIENQISLSQTYKNKSGDLVLVCDSEETRDELKNLVHSAKEDISMGSPNVKRSSITIVGLSREYSSDEVYTLILQNDFMKKFSMANNLKDHIKIHSVKPLKNNETKYQVFASVSQIVREGIHRFRDKLIMGVNSCKVYDRIQTKRCYNCQKFGHYMANCPTPQVHSCGKCSGNHFTRDCTSNDRKCINCTQNNIEHTPHSAFYHKCPSLLKFQELLKQTQDVENLNSKHRQMNHRP